MKYAFLIILTLFATYASAQVKHDAWFGFCGRTGEIFLEELELKTAHYHQQQEITQLKKRYLEKANKHFEQGIMSIKDLLEAQSGLQEAQMKLAEMLFDVKLAELNYYKWSNQILNKFE